MLLRPLRITNLEPNEISDPELQNQDWLFENGTFKTLEGCQN